MDTAKIWRDRAEEARAKAEEFLDPECKRIMLDIAEAYERLAHHESAGPNPEAKQDKPPRG